MVAMLLFAGCERQAGQPLGSEIDESEYRMGQKLVKQGRSQEALAAYLRVIEKRGDAAPESHLEAGIICLQQIKDPKSGVWSKAPSVNLRAPCRPIRWKINPSDST
jgi:hypothetical protein